MVSQLYAAPALAKRDDGANALNRFVAARLAESGSQPADAATLYAEVLKEQPDNPILAGKAYVKGIEAGDFDLALKSVRAINLRGAMEPEMPVLLLADAFARSDWRMARTASLELKSLQNFDFLSPLFNAWIASASGNSPFSNLSAAKKNSTARYYHEEQLILHGLARGSERDVQRLLDDIVERNEVRMAPVRLIAARHYLARKNREQALEILAKERTGPETRLRQLILAGDAGKAAQKVNAKVGAGFLLQRLAADLGMQRATFLSLVMAQAANRIAPKSDYGQLVLAEAYGNNASPALARGILKSIREKSSYGLVAISREVAHYIEDAQYDEAEARLDDRIASEPAAPELQLLLGQVRQARKDNTGAAEAFTRAIALAEQKNYPDQLLARYWLSLGSAQEQAGIWPKGLESLKKANALQPNSASILNYLGYAQLERRENTEEAIAAIRQAHDLRSSSPAITDSLGWAYFVTGDHDRAVTYLERARNGEPQDPTINEHLGDAYWTVGRKYEARYAWRSAKLFADADDLPRLKDKIDLGLRPELVSP